MFLHDYFHPGGLKEFDPVTGSVKPAPPGAMQDEFGCVWKQAGKWYALQSDDESLILQRGSETWRLRPENEFVLSGGVIRKRFTITREGRVVFRSRIGCDCTPCSWPSSTSRTTQWHRRPTTSSCTS